MLRRTVLSIASVAASLALFVGAPAAAFAAADGDAATSMVGSVQASPNLQDFSFESMDADYTLGRAADGTSTLRVVETFVVLFPEYDQNRGMQRRIPDSYNGQPLFPDFVSVTDENGNPRPDEVESDSGDFIMTSRADDFVHGRQTYVFTYTLENVTWSFADTDADEFYWDVNGTAWPQTFGRVSARLHLPADLADAMTGGLSCYVGSQGATQTCEIGQDAAADGGATVDASAAPVGPYQTVTMAVGFAKGTFAQFDSSFLASPMGWLQGVAGLGALAAVVWAAVTRSRKLKDEPGRPTIIAEYTPPPGVDALESAVLLGRTTKAIPAEVLEQAVVGSIRIVEGAKRAFGGVKLQAELLDPSRADRDGRMLLEGLFPGLVPGDIFEFGRSDTRFSSAAQKILKAASTELVSRGFQRPVNGAARLLPVLLALAAGVLVFVLGIIAMGAGVSPAVPVLLMVAVVPVVLLAAGLVSRKPLTASGAEVRDHLLGLKEFIEWAEADRIRMLQSPEGAERVHVDASDPRQVLKLYEALLPYAVVFGQEKEWAKHLVVLYEGNTPYWYYGTSGFDAASFSAGIGSLSASASSSSSTSGGSSGGGSAGGGGGGGGGGGV